METGTRTRLMSVLEQHQLSKEHVDMFHKLMSDLMFNGNYRCPLDMFGCWSTFEEECADNLLHLGFIGGCTCGGCPIKTTELGFEYLKYLGEQSDDE